MYEKRAWETFNIGDGKAWSSTKQHWAYYNTSVHVDLINLELPDDQLNLGEASKAEAMLSFFGSNLIGCNKLEAVFHSHSANQFTQNK